MLSTSIIAHTTSSASLIESYFSFQPLYGRSLAFKDSSCLSIRLSPIYSTLPSLHAAILTPTGRFAVFVCFFTKRISLRPQRRGSTPASCPRHFPSRCAGRTAQLTRLQCSLYATACKVACPTEVTPHAFARVWVFLLPSLPAIGHPHASRI